MRRYREMGWRLCCLCLHTDLGGKMLSVLTIKEWCNGILRCPLSISWTCSFSSCFIIDNDTIIRAQGTGNWAKSQSCQLQEVSPQAVSHSRRDTQIMWLLLLIKKHWQVHDWHEKNVTEWSLLCFIFSGCFLISSQGQRLRFFSSVFG